jgi:hypothetical protein
MRSNAASMNIAVVQPRQIAAFREAGMCGMGGVILARMLWNRCEND